MKQSFGDWIRNLDPGTLADYVSDYALNQNGDFLEFHTAITTDQPYNPEDLFFIGLNKWLKEVYDNEDE